MSIHTGNFITADKRKLNHLENQLQISNLTNHAKDFLMNEEQIATNSKIYNNFRKFDFENDFNTRLTTDDVMSIQIQLASTYHFIKKYGFDYNFINLEQEELNVFLQFSENFVDKNRFPNLFLDKEKYLEIGVYYTKLEVLLEKLI